jgi:zinc D-Ala-D-Ala dipeptidase
MIRRGVVLLATVLAACRVPPARLEPGSARQLVVVTTPDWNSTRGSLRRFSRASSGDSWRAEGAAIPIVVGRTGLALGVGFDDLISDATAPHKHEGDGRAPAGIFPLDTVFGFAPRASAPALRMPYTQLTGESDCVDDVSSLHYNTVVERNGVPRIDWNSAEHMKAVWQYEMGVIVGYNATPPVKGRGSCIFLHIWSGPDSYTAGCTAMDRDELRQLIAWLDERAKPVIVQLPAAEYSALRSRWSLPPTQ